MANKTTIKLSLEKGPITWGNLIALADSESELNITGRPNKINSPRYINPNSK